MTSNAINRTFTQVDQQAFADLSGDRNPIHLDHVLARRSVFGGLPVHGMHLLLWAVDRALADAGASSELRTIRADFRKPLLVGSEVTCTTEERGSGGIALELRSNLANVLSAVITTARCDGKTPRGPLPCKPPPSECKAPSVEEIVNAAGTLDLYYEPELASRLFPNLADRIPARQTAAMLATTRLVGMECPGLESIYSGLSLSFEPGTVPEAKLHYRVAKSTPKLALVMIELKAKGLDATVRAFYNPPPPELKPYQQLIGAVSRGEFEGQRSLVVGGSRGLGKMTAEILAAGGADVRLTYNTGMEDAQRVADEITAGGGKVDILQLDILDLPRDLSPALAGWTPTHLYYYATPGIVPSAVGHFSSALFRHFCNFYISGFLDVVNCIVGTGPCDLRALYPSSVFVGHTPQAMGEYAAAKAAGEIMCGVIQEMKPGLKILPSRLPRLAVDHTVSAMPLLKEDPFPIVLEALRQLQKL